MIVRVWAMCAAAPTGFQNHIAAATANSAIMKLNMANAVRLPTSVSTKNFFSASTTASIRSAVSAIFLTNGAVCATNRSKASPSPACRTALIVCSSNGPSTVRTRPASVSNAPMSSRNNGSSARDTLIPVNFSKACNALSLSSRVGTAAANAQRSPSCPETGAPSADQSAAQTAHPSPRPPRRRWPRHRPAPGGQNPNTSPHDPTDASTATTDVDHLPLCAPHSRLTVDGGRRRPEPLPPSPVDCVGERRGFERLRASATTLEPSRWAYQVTP
ncbi:hypothetical protein JD77_05143 [Micromonospora olivasterospora]|uniref:Uncharacterized protein n=1 Tax=Micromonospora olivasterospora TaxID=1880 RepID=A0A562IGV1_MICOL|nr:hypothetical protein JD77_05143 [Micromonospora olivasterospora]